MLPDEVIAREALARGFVDEARLADARRRQAALRKMGLPSDLLAVLVQGLTPTQVAALRAALASASPRADARDARAFATIAGGAPVAVEATSLAGPRPTGRVDPARVGERIGPYALEGELGRGAMGVVYRARHTELGRLVALKVCTAIGERPRQRFLREGQAAAGLRHPNIVAVHDAGEVAGRAWLAMDLVEGGESLAEHLNRTGPLAPKTAAALIAGVARALAYAHEHGVLHRDVKPANILLVEGGTRPLLVDFGLAKVVAGAESLTRTGELLGTPAFMAPEQAGGRDVDGRTDVWALGATLYAVLAGRSPFQEESLLATLGKVLSAKYPPLSSVRGDVPPALEAIVGRCLEKAPADRYPDAGALADDLERFGREGGSAALALRRRRRALASLLAVGLSTGLLVAGFFAVQAARSPAAPSTSPPTSPPTTTSATATPRDPAAEREAATREAARFPHVADAAARARAAEAWLARNADHPRASEVTSLLAAARLEFPATTVPDVGGGVLVDARRALLWRPDELLLWDFERAAAVRRWPVRLSCPPAVARDGRWVVADGDGKLSMLELEGDLQPWGVAKGLARVDCVTCSPAGLIAVSGYTGRGPEAQAVHVLDAAGQPVRELVNDLPAEAVELAFSPDGVDLGFVAGSAALVGRVTGPVENVAILFVASSGETRWRLPLDSRGDALAFTPDGQRLAVGTSAGQLLLVERASGQVLEQLTSDAANGGMLRVAVPVAVRGLSFSPDGALLYSSWGDATTSGFAVWDLARGAPVRWRNHARIFTHSLSPDGQVLLLSLFDGGVELWRAR